MTKPQSLYGRGRFIGRIQGFVATIFIVGLADVIWTLHKKKKEHEILV